MTDKEKQLRAYDLRRRAERRGDGARASLSTQLGANAARRRARATDAANEVDKHPQTDLEFYAQRVADSTRLA